ncbi:MAG: hypothetical protein WCA79_06320 [Anaerolineales bacterium]
MFNSRMSKLFIFVVVALILATSAYAFAASNTVPGTVAGEGAAVVSGYTVTNVAYTLDATPSKIDSVAFTLSGPATTVEASLTGSGGTFYNCTGVVNNWTCTTTAPQATVTNATSLDIIAKDN